MRAALYEAGRPDLVLDEVDIAEPGPGRVRVRVHHCGICHSDYTALHSAYGASPSVLGHEAAGIVDVVGEGVTMLSPGDKVVLTPIAPCGRCYWCQRNEPGSCVNNAAVLGGAFLDGSTGLSRGGTQVFRGLGVGGFAEYAMTSETGAVKVPDDTPLETACVIGCAVQTGVGAVLNTAKVPEGATVLVVGAGGIGISIVQGARIAGASKIIVSDPVAARRENAKRFGATDVVDPSAVDVVATVYELTGGVGVDNAFDAVGLGDLIHTCIWSTRNGGTTTMVGVMGLEQTLSISPPVVFGMSERKLTGCLLGSCNGRRDIPRLLDLWRAGRLDLEGMITAVRPLAEINEAMDDMTAGRGLRTVFTI
jgi:S-(hydroxymethyl)glutathione dehydrogenase / alcohol dehydrogenase